MPDVTTFLPAVENTKFWAKWEDHAIRGALFKVCSCLCFSGINGFVRYLSLSAAESNLTPLPATELAFIETFFGLFLILPWILSTGKIAFKVTNPPLYIYRAFAASFGIILWYTALSKMPIVQVVAFKYCAPIFTVLGARLFLGERCGWARAFAIGTAFAGALMIAAHELVSNEIDWMDMGVIILFPLGATACYATSAILAKKQVKNDPPQTVVLYLFLLSLPILGVAALPNWVEPLAWQWPCLIIMSALLATAYIFLQHAYVVADITYLVPMSFTRLVAGALIGMFFFQEWPTIWTGVGTFFILIATVSLCKHEVRYMKAKKVKKVKKATLLPAAA